MNDKHELNILGQVEATLEEVDDKIYSVSLPMLIVYRLEEQLRLMQGMYIPQEDTVLQVEAKRKKRQELSEYDKTVLVTSKLRTGMPIDEVTGFPPRDTEHSNISTTVHLTIDDMDFINSFIEEEIAYSKLDLASWFTQGRNDSESTEDLEKEREIWREIHNFQGTQQALSLLRITNTAFIRAGALPHPLFLRYFESQQG